MLPSGSLSEQYTCEQSLSLNHPCDKLLHRQKCDILTLRFSRPTLGKTIT